MAHINEEIEKKDKNFNKNLKPFLWAYEARTKGCKAQHWHEDSEKGYSIVMPIFPAYYEDNDMCTYSMSVIRGSHNNNIYDYGNSAHIDNMLHLDIKVGHTLIFDSKLIHRGGPSSRCADMYVTTDSTDTTKIGAFKNLAIHLRCIGDEELDMDISDRPTFRDILLPPR